MKKRIKRFSVIQTAKLLAALYFVGTAIFMIPFGLIMMAVGGQNSMPFGGLMVLILPVIYGIMGFVFVAVSCLLYNLVASKIGGVEVEIE